MAEAKKPEPEFGSAEWREEVYRLEEECGVHAATPELMQEIMDRLAGNKPGKRPKPKR